MTPVPIAERFWPKVEKTATCWLWRGATTGNGYGHLGLVGTHNVYAHRYAYEALVGPIPKGLTLDHLCRVRNCVNPAHLEPVTMRENLLRGMGFAGTKARQTHCVNGHEFTPENTAIRSYRPFGGRTCRACARLRTQRARAA